MKHLRYFKESLDIGDIKALDKYEYAEYCLENVSIDVTETDKKRITQLLESIYEPYEVFSVEITDFISGKGIMASVAVDKEIIDRERDGEDIIYFLKFEDHYWLVRHQRNSWDNPDRYWLIGDEDLNKLKNVIFE